MLCFLLIWKHERFILIEQTKNFYQGHTVSQNYGVPSQAHLQPANLKLPL